MTDPNKYNPRPHIVAIVCPRCAGEAEYRSAFWFTSKGTSDWAKQRQAWFASHRWPWATEAVWGNHFVIANDPSLFPWIPPGRRGYCEDAHGICLCGQCGRFKHTLVWPHDAWYQFPVREGLLWAWHREQAVALLAYVEAKLRVPESRAGHYLFLHHVPARFLKGTRRAKTAKLIRRKLGY